MTLYARCQKFLAEKRHPSADDMVSFVRDEIDKLESSSKKRISKGRVNKKASGGPVGNVPFGFSKVGVGKLSTLVKNAAEQKAIACMQEWYLSETMTFREISDALAEQGMLSRSGVPFTPMAIRRVLLQEARQ